MLLGLTSARIQPAASSAASASATCRPSHSACGTQGRGPCSMAVARVVPANSGITRKYGRRSKFAVRIGTRCALLRSPAHTVLAGQEFQSQRIVLPARLQHF